MKKQKYILPIILIVGLVIIALAFFFGYRPTTKLSPDEAGERALSFINEALLGQDVQASLISVSPEHNLFKVEVDIQGSAHESYISQDGKLFFIEGINIEEHSEIIRQEAEKSKPPLNLDEFVSCLSEAELVIYGANWCGHTSNLVNLLGGYEAASSIYVECTEQEELCQEKNITDYPTILLSGEAYQGGRNFQDLAAITECELVY